MPSKAGRTTEREMSIAVLKYLAHQPEGEAHQDELRAALPYYVDLTEGDTQFSSTRPGEQLWEQIARNIHSHKDNPKNFIKLGYLDHVPGGGLRITEAGRDFLESLDES